MTVAATTGDIAALVVAIVAGVLVGALVIMLASLNATLRALRETTDELRRSTGPLLAEVRDAVTQANAELGRVDGLLVTTENIANTVDSASRIAYAAFSNPVIKTVAFTTGTSRAWRRLRHRNGSTRR
jgi:Bacterial protein of unknown function (DUF948)